MAKKNAQQSKKALKKTLLKEIETKLADTVNGYHRKISGKKLEKQIHKAGKILARSLTLGQITLVPKEKIKVPKKEKNPAEKAVAS